MHLFQSCTLRTYISYFFYFHVEVVCADKGQSGAKNHVAIDTPVHRRIFYAHESLSTASVGLKFKCNVVNGRVTRSIHVSYYYHVTGQFIVVKGPSKKKITTTQKKNLKLFSDDKIQCLLLCLLNLICVGVNAAGIHYRMNSR